ncbi:MAG: hypothetical protein HOF69_04135 [Campylobacteraceae bacterium]|nr:hypothetical protein [Campylobacteraceae bacterium]MBT3882434.1 hypothetical protein [Campylobacteraceae bacterium]MBT4030641.1 hypothetical protein [Campylobacteraceae bacterium]MBT4179717.1 hypothetical protein [Campylobacteraceae bacterium]MBT4571886.1 hypothetical protein [Campylobacteraceae bacterium]
MSYFDIFALGWNLNAFMFVLNFILVLSTTRSNDPSVLMEETKVLQELKNEFDTFYPNRGFETLATYLIPFTAFFRVGFRMIEMRMFFRANKGTKLFDFMVYKYQSDINMAKRN